ncbi:sphinganine C4-monooxygenase 2-like [Asparagus officinalis]|uniref:sphinganine C4-monooxygenase 2-like n=1 Tax=Asparagus officinalis TaxID=4686 RepID=UPI00098DF2BE|nr:sphinganine C4-monooxygenase 2-like [Asparagus officinalis]
MALGVSEEVLYIFVPTIVYWAYSAMYAMLGDMEKYRLHPKGDENKNVVSKTTVVKGVLMQQALQITASLLLILFIGDASGNIRPQPSLFRMSCQFLIAAVTLDTQQYFMHRFMHCNKFLSRFHSAHHNLIVPYAYGAVYGHPLESLLLEISGGALAILVSGMAPRTAMYFASFATIKAVDDHCGLMIPGNLLQRLFRNNCAYHDVHHQLYGNKYNFSQPFFVAWDKIMGTYMPFTVEKREGGGFEVTPFVKQA